MNRSITQPVNDRRRSRRYTAGGVALPLVLFCVAIAMALCVAFTQTLLLQHRQIQRAGWQYQCLWLAESGCQRALHQLAQSPDYRGEVWTVPAATLGGEAPGLVTIRVEADEGTRHIVVEASYPDDPRQRAVCTREIGVSAPTAEGEPSAQEDNVP